MSGRTLQVGDVYEHWAERDRFCIKEIKGRSVSGTMATRAGVQWPKIELLIETVLNQYLYIGTISDE